ncbi:MAG: glycosyltransferase, partial [Thermoanaerobaculia bacterium]|nr:glycosyltransferase [Thermoanaerobaculia bacterium]
GTLVVASRVGGHCSMIEDGMNGLRVEPGSPEALAAALERVHDDPAWASGIRERAAASVEGRFDWPAIGERIHAGIERARAARA